MSGNSIVIIGAGQAGAQAAASLRQNGVDGKIRLIGAEPTPPYQRPPLSKAYLKGEFEEARLYLRAPAFYRECNIDLQTDCVAQSIDRARQEVVTSNDETIRYDKLLIATGAPPRRLNMPGAELKGVYYLRTLAHSDALRAVLERKGRIVIIGAGYIGLEVAAAMRQAGCAVTVLEMANRVLGRVAGEPVSAFFQKLHEDAGVDLRLGARLERLVGEEGSISGAVLADGDMIECAAVLAGIGAAPAVQLAEAAQLNVENGIVVDNRACTSDANIWAAGDCANFPSARYGRRIRLESIPNAIEQAKAAAANMAGGNAAYDPLPWFWSDQYDVKLQTVGLFDGFDDLVVRGDPGAKSFAVWYMKEGKPISVEAVNDAASFAIGKRLILENAVVSPERLKDCSMDLRSFL